MLIVAAVRSLITYVVIGVYTILLGPVLLLWTVASGRPLALYRAGEYGARLGLFLSGIRMRVLHAERDPLYRAIADFVVDSGRQSVQTLGRTIAEQLVTSWSSLVLREAN